MQARNPIRALLLAALLALAAPAAASAAEVTLDEPAETRFGDPTELTGTVKDAAGVPMPDARVTLVGRRYPFNGEFRRVATATTDAAGAFRFERDFERNWQVRVTLGTDRSKTRRAYVFPRFRLSFKARNMRVIALTQRYRVPHGVDLERPTQFYVGRRGRPTAPLAATADVRQVSSGRFVARATVRIPAAWNGRFRYASCFRYTVGSGMGDPSARCPSRFRFG
jgi:Carboxypeptidase regulatory-like domain